MRFLNGSLAVFLGVALVSGHPVQRKQLPAGHGQTPFDVTRHSVPLERIEDGGPPKDGIPALTDPQFVSAKEAGRFLVPWDRVLGVVHNGVAKAYPVKILNYHELVNDTVADKPVLVSW